MNKDTHERLTIVRDVLNLNQPLQRLQALLASIQWDYVGECASLTKAHLVQVLTRYLDGDLSSTSVESWANMVESREDVEPDPSDEKIIEETLHELANPSITFPLTESRAKILLARLAH